MPSPDLTKFNLADGFSLKRNISLPPFHKSLSEDFAACQELSKIFASTCPCVQNKRAPPSAQVEVTTEVGSLPPPRCGTVSMEQVADLVRTGTEVLSS